MKIDIVCVGQIKEKFFRESIAEYTKRLGKYCKFEISEVEDEKTPDKAGAALEEQIKGKEAQRVLAKLKDNACVVTLEIQGKKMDSPGFAQMISDMGLSGKSHIQFVIGGSLGLHHSVTDRADRHLSFSDMTFPHQLMRVILCEQIYRAFRIINGEPYHK